MNTAAILCLGIIYKPIIDRKLYYPNVEILAIQSDMISIVQISQRTDGFYAALTNGHVPVSD
jgi:hypothetical protein